MADGSRHGMTAIVEATYGVTPATPVMKPIRHTGTTLGLSKSTIQSEEVRADRQIACYKHGTSQVGGDVSYELSYGTFDDFIEAVLGGSWATDTPVAGTDQVKVGVTRRSFSILRNFSDIQPADKPWHLFTGCEFSTMSLSITPSAMVTGTFGIVGSGLATDTTSPTGATFPSPTTTCAFDSFTGELKENGSTIAVITEIQLNLDNGIQPRFVVGSKNSILPQIARSNVNGQITAYFENSTLLDKFIDETPSDIELTLIDGATNQYKFILPNIIYNGGQPDVSGDGPITLAMPFQALYDATETSNFIIERTPV